MNETTKPWIPEHPLPAKHVAGWPSPGPQTNKPEAEAKADPIAVADKALNTATKMVNDQNKHHRQELKQFCIDYAIRFHSKGDCEADKIVETAKAFYAFVRT